MVHVKARIKSAFIIENDEEDEILEQIIDSKLDKMSYNTKGSLYYEGRKIRGFKKMIDLVIKDLEEKGIRLETK